MTTSNPSAASALSERLKDKSLLRQLNLINGAWSAARSGKTHPVINPVNGQEIASVPASVQEDATEAVLSAQLAFPAWAAKPAKERAALLTKWYQLMLEHREDLSVILSSEQGKPLIEALGEVTYGSSFVEWFAEEAKRVYGDVIPTTTREKRMLVIKQPIGVAALITPWNFPSAMIMRKAGPALAAGCTVVIKPAEDTPLSALALAELALRAGIPAGVLNVVTTASPAPVGEVLTSHPAVRKVSFTGSTRVGKLLMSQCAGTVKKVSLELGGNAAFIVFDDADLEAALAGLMAVKFRNAGQTCVSANRIYIQSGVFDRFSAMVRDGAAGLKVGHAFEPGVQLGPLINRTAVDKVQQLVDDAVAKGAQVAVGGKPHELGGLFYQPTVMTNVAPQMRVFSEEIFGPVASLVRFEDEAEVIEQANATPYGLVGYFYSRDIARVWRVAEALEVGMVGVNDGSIINEVTPFGGVKESGIGREGSRYGIEDCLETKYVCIGGIKPI